MTARDQTDAMTIAILPERFWRPRVAATPCHAGAARLCGLLLAVHGRHAGLTPRLAAAILDDQTSLVSPPRRTCAPWALMRENVSDALGAAAGQSDRFWAEVSPALLFSRALVPLVQAAEAAGRRSYLFGEEAAATPGGDAVDYSAHERMIERAVTELAADRRRMGAAFWDGLAFSLWSEYLLRSGSRAAPARPRDPCPDTDPGVIHWLRRLRPAFPHDMRQRRPRVTHNRVKEREPRPRQGGVTGVRLSHSPDEFGDRLMSEAAWPPILQLDRLLHSGYLVRHRPPPLDRRRDVLIAGLFASERLTAGQSLAHAAFLDAALRAAMLLRRSGLTKSDIAVATRSASDGAAAAQVAIEPLDWLDAADPWAAGVKERMAFVRTAGPLPGFLDRGPGAALPAPAHPRGPAGDRTAAAAGGPGYAALEPAAAEWLMRAVAARAFLGLEDAGLEDAGLGHGGARQLAHYDAVNVIVVVSERAGAGREHDAATAFRGLLHRIRRDLGLDGHGHSVSLFLVSDAPHRTFTAVTQSRGAPSPPQAVTGTAGEAAGFEGRLVAHLIDSMLGVKDGA